MGRFQSIDVSLASSWIGSCKYTGGQENLVMTIFFITWEGLDGFGCVTEEFTWFSPPPSPSHKANDSPSLAINFYSSPLCSVSDNWPTSIPSENYMIMPPKFSTLPSQALNNDYP